MKNLEEVCSKAGLKMTDQRRTILRVLVEAEDHPSVETVYERAKAIDSSISMATVYRTLNLLDELELVTKHEFTGGHSRCKISSETGSEAAAGRRQT